MLAPEDLIIWLGLGLGVQVRIRAPLDAPPEFLQVKEARTPVGGLFLLTSSLLHLLTYSLTHLLTYSLTHLLAY